MDWCYNWEWKKGEIPDEICDYIVNNIDIDSYTEGETQDKLLKIRRNVNIQFNNSNWINALLQGYIRYANFTNFHYDLSDEDKEAAQISRYSEGQYYKLHKDFSPQGLFFTRKLSLTVQLSDENDYEGGDLIFNNSSNESVKASRGKGSVIVFDSRISHKVTPVTKGVRYSLVKWYHGDEPLK
tara:strand:- start:72 stop:620 length:549 start_codon:yes stop_codon:yes gene_type:complete